LDGQTLEPPRVERDVLAATRPGNAARCDRRTGYRQESDDRGRKVDANLMGSSGAWLDLDLQCLPCFGFKPVQDLIPRDSFFPLRYARGETLSVHRMAAKEGVKRPLVGESVGSVALESKGDVAFINGVLRKLRRERLVGMIVFGHHHHSAGVAIEPMYDAGSRDPAYPGEIIAMMEQGVDECSVGAAGRRVNNEVGGLV